jgi:hypothetical protein
MVGIRGQGALTTHSTLGELKWDAHFIFFLSFFLSFFFFFFGGTGA